MPSTNPPRTVRWTFAVFLVLVTGALAPGVPPAVAQDLPGNVYTLTGTVTDDRGEPLADATVLLTSPDDEQRKTSTASDGSYGFENLSAGNHTVSASHACCHDSRAAVQIGGTTLEHQRDLELQRRDAPASSETVRIAGRVFDRATDEPIEGAHIGIDNSYEPDSEGDASSEDQAASPAIYRDDRGYQHFRATSGADGSYSVDVNAGRVHIMVEHDGYDVTEGSFQVDTDRTLDIPMRSSDLETVTISGRLVSNTGAPIADGWVSVSPDWEEHCDGDVCTARAEPARGQEPSSDGDWYFHSRDSGYDSTHTDADGRFTLTTQPGAVRLWANARDHVTVERRMQVDDDQRNLTITLERIPPDSVHITGTVTDARTGEPIQYAHVSVENQKWGQYNGTQTAEDGTFELWAKPGYTIVQFRADRHYWLPCDPPAHDEGRDEPAPASDGDATASSTAIAPAPDRSVCDHQERDVRYYARVLTIVPEANTSEQLDVDLERGPEADATIQGWVLNASNGEAVENAHLGLYNEATGEWGDASTDGDGSYRIMVTPGYYTVRVHADGYYAAAENVRVESGEPVELTVRLTPGQTRHGGCCYAYAEGDFAKAEASAGTDGMSAPGAPASEDDAMAGGLATDERSTRTGAPTFTSQGGGLGPYSGGGSGPDDANGAPGPGLLLVVLGLAATALVAVRRRST